MLRPSYAPPLEGVATSPRFIPREPPPLIFQALETLCLTAEDLADLLRVSRGWISWWRTRRARPPAYLLPVLYWLAEARHRQLSESEGAAKIRDRLTQAEQLLRGLAPEIGDIDAATLAEAHAHAAALGWAPR